MLDLQKGSDIPIRQVMELYEYKLASLAHSERSALSSIEAASERCVHLQHRLAQLTTEHNKLRQTTYQTERRLEKINDTLEDMKKKYLEVKQHGDSEIGKNISKLLKKKREMCDISSYRSIYVLSIGKLEKLLAEKDMQLKETKVKLLEMTDLKNNLEEQIEKRNNIIRKLEGNGNRVEKELQKRDEQLKNANSHIDQLNMVR